jgi:hypothetical protein
MRSRNQKLAIATSLMALAWVIAAALFYGSGGINPAGVVPSLGCLISVWGAIKGDSTVMWLGTFVVAAASVLFIFSLGLIVIPATLVLILGSILVSR